MSSNNKLWSVVDQFISQTQREVEHLARSLRNSGSFSSDYGFNDGAYSFRASRTPQGLVVKSCKDGACVTLTLTLPITAASPITIETTSKEGKTETKQVSLNDYLTGVDVPPEMKAIYEKVKNYISCCLPGFISRPDAPSSNPTAETPKSETAPDACAVNAENASTCCPQGCTEQVVPQTTVQPTDSTEPAVQAEFNTIRITRVGDKTIQFEGKPLIKLTTHAVHGRFKEYTVYQTKSGKLVAVKAGLSLWPGEVARNEVKVCTSQVEVLTFFANEAVTRRICAELNWEDPFVEIID